MNRLKVINAFNQAVQIVNTGNINLPARFVCLDNGKLISSDGRHVIRTPLPEDPGFSCLIPGDKILRLLKSLSEENITLRQSEKGLQIVADKVKGQYVAGEGKEYFDDLVKEPAEDTRQDIPLEMVEGLLLARHVTSSDTSKGALCGVKINASTIVATDGRMLVEQTGKSWPEASEILLRRDTLDILAKLNGTPTHWCIEGPRVWFFLDDGTSLGGMILEGDYPDVSKIIAREKLLMKKAILPDALVPALQRHVEQLVEVFDADREVAFNLSPGQILLNSTDTVGVQIEEILEAKGVDCSCSFRVHPSLLLAMLNHTHEMRFAPGEPVVAFEKETDDGRMLHLSSVEWE